MVEIRTYDGDGSDVADLMERVWGGMYGGRKWIPFWGRDTLDFQILAERPRGRDYLVAAYDGTRLVGVFFAEPLTYRVRDQLVEGSVGSWLTVERTLASSSVGINLLLEMQRRHREKRAAFCLGYVAGGRKTAGSEFWRYYAKCDPQNCAFLRRVGHWVRIYDHGGLARTGLNALERIGARALSLLQSRQPPLPQDVCVREYTPADLPACLEAAHRMAADADLSIHWTHDRLALQLHRHAVARTLIVEQSGNISGFLNYHQIRLLGGGTLQAAIIDVLAADQLTHHQCIALLRAAGHRMVEEGIQAAIMLRSCMCRGPALLACGFMPVPAFDHLVCLFKDPNLDLHKPSRIHLLIR